MTRFSCDLAVIYVVFMDSVPSFRTVENDRWMNTLFDKEYKNGQRIRKFLQNPFQWNVFSVHEPCRNFRIPCPFLYSGNGICTESARFLYSANGIRTESARFLYSANGIRTESGRFCIPCQLRQCWMIAGGPVAGRGRFCAGRWEDLLCVWHAGCDKRQGGHSHDLQLWVGQWQTGAHPLRDRGVSGPEAAAHRLHQDGGAKLQEGRPCPLPKNRRLFSYLSILFRCSLTHSSHLISSPCTCSLFSIIRATSIPHNKNFKPITKICVYALDRRKFIPCKIL